VYSTERTNKEKLRVESVWGRLLEDFLYGFCTLSVLISEVGTEGEAAEAAAPALPAAAAKVGKKLTPQHV